MDGHDRLIVDLHLDLSVSFVPLIGLHRDGIRIESCGWFAAKFSFSRVFFWLTFVKGKFLPVQLVGLFVFNSYDKVTNILFSLAYLHTVHGIG